MTESSRVDITALRFADHTKSATSIAALIEHVRAQSKKRFVQTVEATFHIHDALAIRVEVQDRGARMKVPGRGVYACSVNGLMNAIADVIREEHGADPALLDVYQRLLEST